MDKMIHAQSTHNIDGNDKGPLLCCSATTYLKLDWKGMRGREVYRVGGKRQIEVAVT